MICDGNSEQIKNCHAYNNHECMNTSTCGGKVMKTNQKEIDNNEEIREAFEKKFPKPDFVEYREELSLYINIDNHFTGSQYRRVRVFGYNSAFAGYKAHQAKAKAEIEEVSKDLDHGFSEWWGDKAEKWNGKLDIKNFAYEIWNYAVMFNRRSIKHYEESILEFDSHIKELEQQIEKNDIEFTRMNKLNTFLEKQLLDSRCCGNCYIGATQKKADVCTKCKKGSNWRKA